MDHHPRFKFLIPKKKAVVVKEKECNSSTIRDQMEEHEALDKQYDDKIKDHVHKALNKRREEFQRRVRMFLSILFLSHLLVILEMIFVYRVLGWSLFK